MALYRRREKRLESEAKGDEPLPGWLLDYFVAGVRPEHRTPEHREFVHLRYQRSRNAIREEYMKHRAQVIAEAQRLGFTRPDEPFAEHAFARDEQGLPLPLPEGVERVVEGEAAPWWASRADPKAQAILRRQLAEQREGAAR